MCLIWLFGEFEVHKVEYEILFSRIESLGDLPISKSVSGHLPAWIYTYPIRHLPDG